MRRADTAAARAAEVAWGTGQERRVIARWLSESKRDLRYAAWPSIAPNSFFDAILLDKSTGQPVSYLEVKVRRIAFAQFGDTIWPEGKWQKAMDAWAESRLPTIAIVEYTDALVELRLDATPDWRGDITRTDRGYAVPHVRFDGPRHHVIPT